MRFILTKIIIGIALLTGSAAAQDMPGGVTSLLADQITGIEVLSFNQEPPRVKESDGRFTVKNNLEGEKIVAQTRCAGYEMEHGESWRFCEVTHIDDGDQDYFWLNEKDALVVGPVNWN